jgi:polyribonucleotide nucleotidyltransferase
MANVGDKLLDKRIVERNIAKGLVSKAEYEKHLADLADREGAYDQLAVELDDTADGVATE